jgi:pimeloyl-ACP methyl ester carboxylesterase
MHAFRVSMLAFLFLAACPAPHSKVSRSTTEGLPLSFVETTATVDGVELDYATRGTSTVQPTDPRDPSSAKWRTPMSQADAPASVVLVHGGFVDGSGWQAVHAALTRKGHRVSVVQHPTGSLAEDVAYTKRAISALDGPVILVGHSYGGVVITEAGTDPKVAALVYIAAFAPDKGESVSSLIKDPQPGAPVPPILPPKDGYLFLDRAKFPTAFAADVDPATAQFMADSQVPWGVAALEGAISQPAWKTKPSWYLVTTDDRMIPPSAQRLMSKRAGATVVEVKASHSVYVSKPDAVAALITEAAQGLRGAAQSR